MSYSFDYDPQSGQTPWPLIWTVSPTEYNWEGNIGQDLSFTTKAIPDPDYPSAWNDYYSSQSGGGMGGPAPVIPPLPPQPVVTEYVYESGSTLDQTYVQLDIGSGVVVPTVKAAIFFPYADIRYFKNGTEKSASYPQQVIDDNFDYVVALVPDSRESITKNAVVRVQSTSTKPLSGDFKFKIWNDWSEARTTLEAMAAQSKQYFDDLADSMGSQDSPKENTNNTEESIELEPTMPESAEESATLSMTENKTYDEIFRIQNQEEINNITQNEPNLIEDIQKDTIISTTPFSQEAAFGTEALPVDELLRNNDIDTLMSKYGYTYDEIIEMLRKL